MVNLALAHEFERHLMLITQKIELTPEFLITEYETLCAHAYNTINNIDNVGVPDVSQQKALIKKLQENVIDPLKTLIQLLKSV